jgi:hypothetical protein
VVSARLFVAPQLTDGRLYFISSTSVRQTLARDR